MTDTNLTQKSLDANPDFVKALTGASYRAGNKIYSQIPKIMGSVGAIAKTRRNKQGEGYMFRGIDDFYLALQGLLAEHAVFVAPEVLEHTREERQSRSGGNLIYTIMRVRFRFFADDGSSVDVITVGEAMDSGDKSANKAMSASMKYAFTLLFCVPTEEEKDTESETHEVEPMMNPKCDQPARSLRPVAQPTPIQSGKPAPRPSPVSTPSPIGQPVAPKWKASQGQIARIFAIGNSLGFESEKLKERIKAKYKIEHFEQISKPDYETVCNELLDLQKKRESLKDANESRDADEDYDSHVNAYHAQEEFP